MVRVNKKDWSILSTYRNEIFGLSIIGIIILHYFQNILKSDATGLPKIISTAYFDIIGSTGVEIFLFLSGMGLYFSMTKDSNVLKFYGRRLKRLLLAYTLWGGTFWVIRDMVLLNYDFERVLYDFFFLSFWRDGVSSVWFIAFIIVLYLVYPIIHRCFRSDNSYRTAILWILILSSVACTSWCIVYAPNVYANIKLALYRVPIFLIGAYYGKKIHEKANFSIGDTLLILLGLVANLLFIINKSVYKISFMRYIDVEYIKCIYSISLVVIMAWTLSYFKKGFFNRFLIATGALSLELYMTHVNIRNIMTVMGFKLNELWLYTTCVLLSIACSIVISNICKGILYLFGIGRQAGPVVQPERKFKIIVIE